MKITLLGTGLMGHPMALRLLAGGYDLTVFNRTRSKTSTLEKRGARVAADPEQAAAAADAVITMLTDFRAVGDTLLKNPRAGFKGKTIIQMGTISSRESLLLMKEFQKRGASYVEAPVLGSIPQVETGSLIILFGGTQKQFDQWQGLLGHFGEKRVWMGPVGQAMAAKLALNQLIAVLTTGFSLSLGFLLKKKVDIDRFMDILRESPLYAPTFDKKRTRMLERRFEQPNFPVKHLLKDMELIIREFRGQKISVGPLREIALILEKAVEQGYAELDYSALHHVVNPR